MRLAGPQVEELARVQFARAAGGLHDDAAVDAQGDHLAAALEGTLLSARMQQSAADLQVVAADERVGPGLGQGTLQRTNRQGFARNGLWYDHGSFSFHESLVI